MLKSNPCKKCGATYHTAMYHKRSPLNKRGKVAKAWIDTKHKWLEQNKSPYYFCYICGKMMTRTQLTLDHVKSRSRYPELRNSLKNLQPCCYTCNTDKGSLDLEQYQAKLAERSTI